MRRSKFLWLAAVSTTALAASAQAQDGGRARGVSIDVSARATYDTNVLRGRDIPGAKRQDWILSPGVSVDADLPVGRQTFFARAGAFYDFYTDNDRFNRERLTLDGGVASRIARCEATVSVGYARGRSDILSFDLGAENDDPENVLTRTSAGVNLGCPSQFGFSPTAGYRRSRTENSALLRSGLDADTNSYNLGLAYRRPGLGAVSVFGDRSETTYRNVPGDVGFDVDSFGASYAREFGTRLKGAVRVASTKVEPRGSGARSFSGATYGGDVTARLTPRLDLVASYDKRIDPGQRVGAQYSVRQGAAVRLNYSLGTRVTVGAGVSRDKLRSEGGLVPVPDSRVEALDSVFASARYQAGRRWALVGDVRHDKRDSNRTEFNYTGTRASVTAVLSF